MPPTQDSPIGHRPPQQAPPLSPPDTAPPDTAPPLQEDKGYESDSSTASAPASEDHVTSLFLFVARSIGARCTQSPSTDYSKAIWGLREVMRYIQHPKETRFEEDDASTRVAQEYDEHRLPVLEIWKSEVCGESFEERRLRDYGTIQQRGRTYAEAATQVTAPPPPPPPTTNSVCTQTTRSPACTCAEAMTQSGPPKGPQDKGRHRNVHHHQRHHHHYHPKPEP